MSKRALLWSLGGVAFVFTYIAAVNVSEVHSNIFGLYRACSGWNPAGWFSAGCSASLPPRLGVLALGAAVVLVCGYFAEKGRPGMAELVGGHTVRYDSVEGMWICHDEKCSFKAATRFGARNHAVETGARPAGTGAAVTANGLTSDMRSVAPATTSAKPVPQHSAPSVNRRPTPPSQAVGDAEYKTCPDCAEEVRTAARKCRFCGYEFVDTAASGFGA